MTDFIPVFVMVAALIGAGIATVCGVIAWLVPLVRDAKRERRFNKRLAPAIGS
jgi:hypothetical protein